MTEKRHRPGGPAPKPRRKSAPPGDVATKRVDQGVIDALLEPYRYERRDVFVSKEDLEAELREAERAFSKDHDLMAGLRGAVIAMQHGVSVPRRIAFWLSNGIDLYLYGRRDSIDASLGLNIRGRQNPRRKQAEALTLKEEMKRMMALHQVFATIEQAAALVAHHPTVNRSVSTLVDRYKRSGYGERVRQARAALRAFGFPPTDPSHVLAEYPDEPLEVRQAKAAIRKVYVKKLI